MAYTPDPTNPLQPVETVFASTAAAEFRALKQYLQELIAGGGGFQISAGQRNLIRNPNFRINQRNMAVANASGQYPCDGWKLDVALGAGLVQATADTIAPEQGSGSLYIQTAAPQAAPAAGNYAVLSMSLEGFDIASLLWGTINAKPVTISFQVQVTIAGVYTVAIRNGASDRSYCAAVNLVAGNQQVEVTIPGDTSGIWSRDSGKGLTLVISAGAGATFTAPAANAWVAGNFVAAPGQVWMPATNGAFVRMWQMQMEQGTKATSFTCLNMQAEVARAQRYYEPGLMTWGGYNVAGGSSWVRTPFHVTKRIAPTMAYQVLTSANVSVFDARNPNVDNFEWFATITATGQFSWNGNWQADADI